MITDFEMFNTDKIGLYGFLIELYYMRDCNYDIYTAPYTSVLHL